MPAFYCGIFGHKPTVGAINTRGCTFRTGKEQSTMVVAGPMTRSAKDLLPLFKVNHSNKIFIFGNHSFIKFNFYHFRF